MYLKLPSWYSIVKNNICHRTGIKALKGIFDTGAILPNDGRFPDSYPQSKRSFARIHKLISLFDFNNQTDEESGKTVRNWYRFFFDHKPVTIVILLDRKILCADLITNKDAVEITKGSFDPIFLPDVEAFYPKQIPCNAFTGYLMICSACESIYEFITHIGLFPEFFMMADDFVKRYKEIYKDPLKKLEQELKR